MGHQTKLQRQQAAMERKRKYLDKPEQSLRDAVLYAGTCSCSTSAQAVVEAYQRALVLAYIECGYEKLMAEGMARAVAKGGTRESWST